jgi:hypothetical protein
LCHLRRCAISRVDFGGVRGQLMRTDLEAIVDTSPRSSAVFGVSRQSDPPTEPEWVDTLQRYFVTLSSAYGF